MTPNTPDAIELLDADHLLLHGLFTRYAELVRARAPATQRRLLAEEICTELTIHSKLEEELFYPAVREALLDDDVVDEAEDQHGSVKDFVAQILASRCDDELYDARVAVLRDYVERHVRQEREQLFNRVASSRLNLKALARSLTIRKEELRAVADALREDTLAQAGA